MLVLLCIALIGNIPLVTGHNFTENTVFDLESAKSGSFTIVRLACLSRSEDKFVRPAQRYQFIVKNNLQRPDKPVGFLLHGYDDYNNLKARVFQCPVNDTRLFQPNSVTHIIIWSDITFAKLTVLSIAGDFRVSGFAVHWINIHIIEPQPERELGTWFNTNHESHVSGMVDLKLAPQSEAVSGGLCDPECLLDIHSIIIESPWPVKTDVLPPPPGPSTQEVCLPVPRSVMTRLGHLSDKYTIDEDATEEVNEILDTYNTPKMEAFIDAYFLKKKFEENHNYDEAADDTWIDFWWRTYP